MNPELVRSLIKRFVSGAEGERGQIIVLSAAVLTLLLVFSAMAIDIGIWLHTRTKLQADADAMALAGAQKLCAKKECDEDAIELARIYGPKNGVSDPEIKSVDVGVDCDGNTSANHDWITVRTQRTVKTFLANLVGILHEDIEACATARKAEVAGGTGVVPFGIEDDCIADAAFGEEYTIKYDSASGGASEICDQYGGNFALLAIDTSGGGAPCGDPPDTLEELKLKQAICFGANRFLCAKSASNCTGQIDDDGCASFGFPQDDQSCTETGNVSAIKEAIDWRLTNTVDECDEWEEVVYIPDGGLKPECNPWLNAGSKRVIMIPVIDRLFEGSPGRKIVDVVSFAIFYLEGLQNCSSSGPGGGNCEVVGKFITSSLTASYEALDDLDENSTLTVVVLTH